MKRKNTSNSETALVCKNVYITKYKIICWLLAVGCWLLAVGCWLLAVGCWLLADCAKLRLYVKKNIIIT